MTEAQASADDGEWPKTPEPVGAVSKLSLSDLYIQAYTNMRATDEISLKLLAAIPFVSGVGISLLVRKPTEAFPAGARLLVSLFAAVVTFAIYRWERRNISTCKRYRDYAAYLEKKYGISPPGQEPPKEPPKDRFFSRRRAKTEAEILLYWTVIAGWKEPPKEPPKNRFFSRRWGKTEAEILLYWTVIAGWLATGIYVFFI